MKPGRPDDESEQVILNNYLIKTRKKERNKVIETIDGLKLKTYLYTGKELTCNPILKTQCG